MQITAEDSSPKIFFQNDHEVQNMIVNGDFCICNFNTMKINSMTFDVVYGSLSIVQNKDFPVNRVLVSTRYGAHCLAANLINPEDQRGLNCPDLKQRTEGISDAIIERSEYCKSEVYLCSDKVDTCPSIEDPVQPGQASFDIILDDGPIQFLIDDSPIQDSVSFNPIYDTFALTSQNQLRENKEEFSKETKDPNLYVYEISSPGYYNTWVHSFLLQYLEARPWLISMLSLNFMSPVYKYETLIRIPGGVCPNPTPLPVPSKVEISDKIRELSYIEPKHAVAEVTDNGYTMFMMAAQGSIEEKSIHGITEHINFIHGNILILLCFIFMILAAFVMVVLILFCRTKLKNGFEKLYTEELQNAKRFSKAKAENKDHESLYHYQAKKTETEKTETEKTVKYIEMGTLSAKTVKMKESELKKKSTLEREIKDSKLIHLSFYKVIHMIMESLEIKYTNSVESFLKDIQIDDEYFEQYQGELDNDFLMMSIRRDELLTRYLEYCTKFGYNTRDLTEEKKTFEEKGLTFKTIQNSSTAGFTKIRWKTYYEKVKAQHVGDYGLSISQFRSQNDTSVISRFLNSECISSEDASDFILKKDLEENYYSYCTANKIDEIQRENISNSEHILDFGAVYKKEIPLIYITGITRSYSRELLGKGSLPGLIRKTFKDDISMWYDWFDPRNIEKLIYCLDPRNIKKVIDRKCSCVNKLVWNVIVSLIYLVIIFIIPIFLLCLVTYFLQEVNYIQKDIDAPIFTFRDFFHSNSFDHWFDHLPLKWLFYLISFFSFVFIVSGLAELVCFLFTDRFNTGMYPVLLNKRRWLIHHIFWILLMFYTVLYLMYFGVVLLWFILGSILNPEKFLPLASGAIVIISVIYYVYTNLSNIDNFLTEEISKTVDEQLHKIIMKSIGQNEKIKELMEKVENIPQATFNKAINIFMELNDYPLVDREKTDEILNGNAGAIIDLFSLHLGVDEDISLALVSIILKNKPLMLESVRRVSINFKQDPTVNMIIAETFMQALDQSQSNKMLSNTIILCTKRLCNKIFPYFESEIIDDIIKIAYNRNMQPLKTMAKNFGMPTELLSIADSIFKGDKSSVQENLLSFSESILPKNCQILFCYLNKLLNNQVFGNNDELKDIFDQQVVIPNDLVYALSMRSRDLIRYALKRGITKFCEDSKNEELKEMTQTLKDMYISLSVITSGCTVNINQITKFSVFDIDNPCISILARASLGDRSCLNQILSTLNLEEYSTMIQEMADMVYRKKINFKEIFKRLNIPNIRSEKKLLNLNIGKKSSELEDKEEAKSFEMHFLYIIEAHISQGYTQAEDFIEDIEELFKAFGLKAEQRECLKALLNLLTHLTLKVPSHLFQEYQDDQKKSIYHKSIQKVSSMLGMRYEFLDFVLDIFSAEPSKIFGYLTPKPKVQIVQQYKNSSKSSSKYSCNISFISKSPLSKLRTSLLTEVLRVGPETVKRIGCIWIYFKKIINSTYHKPGLGKSSQIEKLAEILGVDIEFFNILMEYRLRAENSFDMSLLIPRIAAFIKSYVKRLESNLKIGKESTKGKFLSVFKSEIGNTKENYEQTGAKDFESLKDFHLINFGAGDNENLPESQKDSPNMIEIFRKLCGIVYDKDISKLLSYKLASDKDSFFVLAKELYTEKNLDCLLALAQLEKMCYNMRAQGVNYKQCFEDDRTLVKDLEPSLVLQEGWGSWFILFNGVCLTTSLKTLPPDSKLLKNFVGLLQGSVGCQSDLSHLSSDIENLLPELFNVGFFDHVCKNWKPIQSEKVINNKPEYDTKMILGIMISFCSREYNHLLLRDCVLKIKDTDTEWSVKAMLSVVDTDPSDEENLKRFFKFLKTDPRLCYNLMKLTTHYPGYDCYQACYEIMENKCSFDTLPIISALVSVFKKDISNLSVLSNCLGVNHENFRTLFSLATKNPTALIKRDKNTEMQENTSILAQHPVLCSKLKLPKKEAVEVMLKIACGDINVLRDYSLQTKDIMDEQNFSLFESIVHMHNEKMEKWRFNKTLNIKQIFHSLNIISARLCINLGLPSPNSDTTNSQSDNSEDSFPKPSSKTESAKLAKQLKNVVEQLSWYSMEEPIATNKTFSALKELYKLNGITKDFPYTIKDLKRFPQMLFQKINKKVVKEEYWRLNGNEVEKYTKPCQPHNHQIFINKKARDYHYLTYCLETSQLSLLHKKWEDLYKEVHGGISQEDRAKSTTAFSEDYSADLENLSEEKLKNIYCSYSINKTNKVGLYPG